MQLVLLRLGGRDAARPGPDAVRIGQQGFVAQIDQVTGPLWIVMVEFDDSAVGARGSLAGAVQCSTSRYYQIELFQSCWV